MRSARHQHQTRHADGKGGGSAGRGRDSWEASTCTVLYSAKTLKRLKASFYRNSLLLASFALSAVFKNLLSCFLIAFDCACQNHPSQLKDMATSQSRHLNCNTLDSVEGLAKLFLCNLHCFGMPGFCLLPKMNRQLDRQFDSHPALILRGLRRLKCYP